MASEKYNYVLTQTAEADVDDIFAYIAGNLSNPDAASDFADELEMKVADVCKNPKSGKPVDNDYLKRDDVRRILVGNYVVYYIVDEDKRNVVILRVVYGKRDQDQVLRKI